MAKNVTWDGSKNLKISAEVKFNKIIDENAEKCRQRVKSFSPDGSRTNKKYKDGWTLLKGRKDRDQYYVEVWNETNWQLTHLLENGHLIVNKKGGVGWASAKPHIQKALDSVKQGFINQMERAEVEIDIE